MSVTALRWAYKQQLGSAARKAVLVSLAEQADDDTLRCFPSQGFIATRAELAVRTVRRELAWLEERGYIRRTRRFDKHGHRNSDWFTVLVSASLPATQTGGHTGQWSESASLPAAQAIPTGQGDRVTVKREPSEEPSTGRARRDPAPKDDASKTDGTRGTRLTEDWMPSLDDIAWQRDEGIPDDLARYETENFKDYWLAKAGADARKVSWSRTWKKWMRTAVERASMPRATGAPQPVGTERRPSW